MPQSKKNRKGSRQSVTDESLRRPPKVKLTVEERLKVAASPDTIERIKASLGTLADPHPGFAMEPIPGQHYSVNIGPSWDVPPVTLPGSAAYDAMLLEAGYRKMRGGLWWVYEGKGFRSYVRPGVTAYVLFDPGMTPDPERKGTIADRRCTTSVMLLLAEHKVCWIS